MTPYELRFEIFKLAQGLAESEFYAEFEETERCNKSVDENGGPRLEYPKYPSFHKIETLADRINSFVSSKV
jgi:hypothetical protein